MVLNKSNNSKKQQPDIYSLEFIKQEFEKYDYLFLKIKKKSFVYHFLLDF